MKTTLALSAAAALWSFSLAENFTIPAQLGPYPVTIRDHEIRTNRTDPLAPSPQPRRFMITVYQPHLDIFACPADQQANIAYVPNAVAEALQQLDSGELVPAAAWESFQLTNCTRSFSNSAYANEAPIVLFSPALQSSRYIYASTLQAVASSGYTVIAIDHTYDAVAVVFPDGTVAPNNVSTAGSTNSTFADVYSGDFLQPIRVADAVSVLDAIEADKLPGFSGHSKPLKTAMYGHSLGGSSSAAALGNDSRIVSGMNIDGSFLGFVRNLTIDRPFVMLGEEKLSAVSATVAFWPDFFDNNLRGWKTWAQVNGTVHVGFTDSPLLVDLLGIRKNLTPAEVASFTGTIDSRRNQEIIWRYTVNWLSFVLRGKKPALLDMPSAQFPDIRIVGHKNA